MADKRAIMVGGPENGFDFHGPFDFGPEAIEYADETFRSEAWWVVTLIEPEKSEEDADRQLEQMASALAISEGYNPNDIPVAEWAEAKSRYRDQAQTVLGVLATDQKIEDEDDDPLEQPDEEEVDD